MGKTSRNRHQITRLDLLEALIEHRGELLMEAMVAGCAIVAFADGEAVPAERRRVLAQLRSHILLSLFPHDRVAAEFDAHADAFDRAPAQARAAALRLVAPLAPHPRLARVVLRACLDVTVADGVVHPGEVKAVSMVRDALGLGPDPSAPCGLAAALPG